MKTKISGLAMTIFAFSAIFVGVASGAQAESTQIVFKGPEAKMSLNLFKFQLKNKIRDLNLNLTLKFVPFEKEISFDIRNLKSAEIKRRLKVAIRDNHNCSVIKDNEPDQIMALAEYHDCVEHASNGDNLMNMNKKQYPDWKVRLISESKLSLVREEMVLEAVNLDSDTVSMLTGLAVDVQQEVNNLRPNSSEISVLNQYAGRQ